MTIYDIYPFSVTPYSPSPTSPTWYSNPYAKRCLDEIQTGAQHPRSCSKANSNNSSCLAKPRKRQTQTISEHMIIYNKKIQKVYSHYSILDVKHWDFCWVLPAETICNQPVRSAHRRRCQCGPRLLRRFRRAPPPIYDTTMYFPWGDRITQFTENWMRSDFQLEVGGFFGSTKEIQDDGRFVWIQQNPIKKNI